MRLLHSFRPRRAFPLPSFELAPLEFEPEAGEELLLDEVVASIEADSRVVRLVRPMPTAGELQASIERHLRGEKQGEPRVDAAAELRDALAELRRSLG